MNLEKELERIELIQLFADTGICGEYWGIVPKCPMYAEDCPGTCTYAKNKNGNARKDS